MQPLPAVPTLDAAVEQRNRLVDAHLDLVQSIARSLLRRLPPSIEFDDLAQEGYLGLMRAAESYFPVHEPGYPEPVSFRMWAAVKVRGAMIESVRRRHYRAATMEPLDDAAPEKVVSIDFEGGIARKQMARRVQIALVGLSDADRDTLRIYFTEEGRLAGVGERFGVKSSRSSQILHRALDHAERECRAHGIASAA
jgi:RNA polymerase sigma factor (sigma-70 family)